MSDRHKNFEDKLRDRLLNEDLPYDKGAWEQFQSYAESPANGKKMESEASKKKFGFWRWMMLFFFLLTGGALGYYSLQIDKGELTETSFNNNEQISKNKRGQFSSTNNEIEGIEKGLAGNDVVELSRKENSAYQNSNWIQDNGVGKEIPSGNENISSKSYLTADESKENQKQISFSSGERNSANSESKSRYGEGVSISERSKKLDNDFNLDLENPLLPKDLENGQNGKRGMESRLTPNNVKKSLPGNDVDESNIGNDKDNSIIASIEDDQLRSMINMERIDLLVPSGLTPPDRDISIQDFIIPLKYPKNEFYVGAGFVNSFSELSVSTDFGKAADTPIDISYYTLGYARKFAPSWSLGLELNLAHVQNLNMSRRIQDYHQTSTSFEYIEGVMSHGHSNFLSLPIMLKYQPLNTRFSFYGGAYLAYAYGTNTSFDNEFSGENPTVEELRVFHTGSDYVGKWDTGLIAGASFRIWKGLEVEGRVNLGLIDLSDDYYWGEGRSTASTYRIGLKYRFIN